MKSNIFAVIGLGIFGMKVSKVLSEKGFSVLAIDNHEKLVDKAKEFVTQAILLDTTKPELLAEVPFQDVDVAIVAIGDDIESNILTTATLKDLGIPRIISRSVNEIHYKVLQKIGADEVVNVEEATAEKVATKLISPDILDRIKLTENVSIAEIAIHKGLAGMELHKLDLQKNLNVQVSGIIRKEVSIEEDGNAAEKELFLFPDQCGELKNGDTIILVGDDTNLDKIMQDISE